MTFGIIGFGRFGKLWARCLKPFGTVRIFDAVIRKGSLEKVVDVDMVFLLVPISEIDRVCEMIRPYLRPHTIVLDACSVKAGPVVSMKKMLPRSQPIIATHPLFGPDSVRKNGLEGQRIALCPVRAKTEQVGSVERLLKKMKLVVIRTTPKEHDRQMAKSQALVHFIGRGLSNLHLAPQELATPDYLSLVHMNEMVQHDTWQLFFDMQRLNPEAQHVRSALLSTLQRLDHEISSGKRVGPPAKHEASIAELRDTIDELDRSIIKLIAQRFAVANKIGKIKKSQEMNVLDVGREQRLQGMYEALAVQYHLPIETVHSIFSLLIKESRRIQNG